MSVCPKCGAKQDCDYGRRGIEYACGTRWAPDGRDGFEPEHEHGDDWCVGESHECLTTANASLKAVVDRLPLDADGKAVIPCLDALWFNTPSGIGGSRRWTEEGAVQCGSRIYLPSEGHLTIEAALAAHPSDNPPAAGE